MLQILRVFPIVFWVIFGYANCWCISTDPKVRGANGLAVLRLWVDNAEVPGWDTTMLSGRGWFPRYKW